VDASWFEAVRYYGTLVLWLSLPAAVVFWVIIHPLADFWRRLGPTVTYLVVLMVLLPVGYVCWLWRGVALEARYPARLSFVVAGLALYALAVVIEVKCRKHLKLRTLVGVPELSAEAPGKLLTEGIYGQTRNPRYLDLMIAMFGFALIFNYRAMHWMAVLCVPAFYLVTRLEERELRQRFGAPYEAYLSQVPRFVPRSWSFLRS